ncbi:hypothetical protein ABG768_008706 [Culter alburnus]|uniref:Uncharacterized protein n=1 Tax=Culter alburnus TaxID=194366 RepID=A0AAW1ZHB9_CULAL
MFTRLLFFWLTGALLLPLIWGTALVNEEDEVMITTPDYDYNFTHDYYSYNETYESLVILPDAGIPENTGNQGNTNSVSVYKHYGILAGLLVLQICQQT